MKSKTTVHAWGRAVYGDRHQEVCEQLARGLSQHTPCVVERSGHRIAFENGQRALDYDFRQRGAQ